MKLTSFNPMIISPEAEKIIGLFEALGFVRQHHKEGFMEEVSVVRMKDANGFHVDVVQGPVPRDVTTIRANVDDFDEAYAFLTAHGFKNIRGDQVADTGSSRGCRMVSPSGFSISISKHMKHSKEEKA